MPRFFTLFKAAILSATLACLFFVSWYGLIAMKFGTGIIEDFFAYQIRLLTTGDAGHGQPFYYHALVLLLGCFPISILAVLQYAKNDEIDYKVGLVLTVSYILFSYLGAVINNYFKREKKVYIVKYIASFVLILCGIYFAYIAHTTF